MWEKIKKILGRNVSKKLLPLELAKDLCEASFQESVDILNEVFGTLQPSRSNILPKCFFELFAYYQYLVLIYVANILDLKGERLNLYGGELNVACGEIAKKNIEYGPLIERAITDQQFHHLVSAYVAGNKSISGLSDERFSELLKFVGFEKGSKDPIMTSGAVSFSRILEALGSSYQSGDLLSVIMPTWIVHSNAVTGFRGLLNIKFKNAYPDRVI